jgi:hypothetical protein
MAPCARDRQTQQAAGDRIDAVLPFLGHHLRRIAAVILRSQADEPQRHVAGLVVGIDDVGRQLPADELVVRHVDVERADHPVAIEIRVGVTQFAVVADNVCLVLGIPRHVEPQPRPTLAIVRRRQQPFNEFLIRSR